MVVAVRSVAKVVPLKRSKRMVAPQRGAASGVVESRGVF